MKKLLLGKKVGMTQLYKDDGKLIPVSVIQVGPCPIVQLKTKERDGYCAVQFGFRETKENRLSLAEKGHLKKANVGNFSILKEFRVSDNSEYNVGDVLTVDQFKEGQKVDIIGTTKGKSFQGVVKRYGFGGGPQTHGHMTHRRGGSYGMRTEPGHVLKNKKMPGHMGDVRRTVQNLEIVKIIADKNVIVVEGSVPGANGGILMVRESKKSKN